ncbi:MAG TPA: pyridoxal-phosphate dependent enzyme, partial [Candidatus Udaeobacter sp.]|nr:pyridoxal-phosphate dependent enzyme [Candidatus Udaeobacter sp.]
SQINAMYRKLIGSGRVKWYDCGTDNPFRYEGKKTYAYEIAQDLGWRVPDRVLHPCAGGMSLVKTWKGFNELRTLGWIDRLPKMTAVQAARCAPIVESWKKGLPRVEPVEKQPTIASAVAAADPGLLGDQTLAAVRASDGDALAVEEVEITEAVRLLAQEGLMIEPSGAVTIAAVRRGVQDGLIDRAEAVVCVLTGSGFKDFDRILDLVEIPRDVVSGYEAMLAEAERI